MKFTKQQSLCIKAFKETGKISEAQKQSGMSYHYARKLLQENHLYVSISNRRRTSLALTTDQVENLAKQGWSQGQIANHFQVAQSTVSKIINGVNYKKSVSYTREYVAKAIQEYERLDKNNKNGKHDLILNELEQGMEDDNE